MENVIKEYLYDIGDYILSASYGYKVLFTLCLCSAVLVCMCVLGISGRATKDFVFFILKKKRKKPKATRRRKKASTSKKRK